MSAIPSWAVKGRKVVCLNSKWKRGKGFTIANWLTLIFGGLPIAGGVYTITKAGWSPVSGEMMLCLKGWGGTGFHISNFRPLITLEDDISTHFAALLDVKQPSPVTA